MKTKKKKSPVLVLFTILFLAIFIILPPLFRSIFPKQTTPDEISTTQKLLTCTKSATNDGYNITSKILYTNNIPKRNSITYIPVTNTNSTKPDTQKPNDDTTNITTPSTDPNQVTESTKTVQEELIFFKGIDESLVKQTDTLINVVIKEETINLNSNNLELANYLLPLKDQKTYYTNQGYLCTTTTF